MSKRLFLGDPDARKIGARTFATGALVQMMVMFLFSISLSLFGFGKTQAFWINPVPSTKGSLWVNLQLFNPAELLPTLLLTGIIFTVVLFVLGFRVGTNIWNKRGKFVRVSLLSFFAASIIVGGLCALMLGSTSDVSDVYFTVFLILIYFVPGILTATLSGWVTKKRLEDYAHKSGFDWPEVGSEIEPEISIPEE